MPHAKGRAAIGIVFPREKYGAESVPCKMLTSVTGLRGPMQFFSTNCIGLNAQL
jgi:hypothetical protein